MVWMPPPATGCQSKASLGREDHRCNGINVPSGDVESNHSNRRVQNGAERNWNGYREERLSTALRRSPDGRNRTHQAATQRSLASLRAAYASSGGDGGVWWMEPIGGRANCSNWVIPSDCSLPKECDRLCFATRPMQRMHALFGRRCSNPK